MKKVKEEILQYMTGLERVDGNVSARFLFPGSFVGFQGHFPDKKILPGVCQVQCALSMVEQTLREKVSMRELVLAKYFAPVAPNEEIRCACSDVGEAGEFVFKASITKGTTRVAELKMRVAVGEPE